MVAWRDCAGPDGASPRGSGFGYRCFSLGSPDTDGDGQVVGAEGASGYDPLDPTSQFVLDIGSVDLGLNTITFQIPNSNPGKTYSLIKSVDDFRSFDPVPGQQNFPGNGGNLTSTDNLPAGSVAAWKASVPQGGDTCARARRSGPARVARTAFGPESACRGATSSALFQKISIAVPAVF